MKPANRIIAELRSIPATVTPIRTVRRRLSKELAATDRETVLGLAQELIRQLPFGRFVACELVEHHAPSMRSITRAEIERLGQGMASWSDVDVFACCIAGPAWRTGRLSDAVIRAWARSPDRWYRRAALVSTVPLNSKARGGKGDTVRTLAICRLLIADRDDMVVKALSWALRTLGQRDPESVRRFLAGHADELAARVVREVRNKLDTGLKNPR